MKLNTITPEEEPVYTIIKSRVIKIIHRSGREEIINHSANKSLELESLRAKIKLQKNLDKIKKTELDSSKKQIMGFFLVRQVVMLENLNSSVKLLKVFFHIV